MQNRYSIIQYMTLHNSAEYINMAELRKDVLYHLMMLDVNSFFDTNIFNTIHTFLQSNDIYKVFAYKKSTLTDGYRAFLNNETGNEFTVIFNSIADRICA